eukprot:jgi/Mesvir1/13789/Mv15954-RA.1
MLMMLTSKAAWEALWPTYKEHHARATDEADRRFVHRVWRDRVLTPGDLSLAVVPVVRVTVYDADSKLEPPSDFVREEDCGLMPHLVRWRRLAAFVRKVPGVVIFLLDAAQYSGGWRLSFDYAVLAGLVVCAAEGVSLPSCRLLLVLRSTSSVDCNLTCYAVPPDATRQPLSQALDRCGGSIDFLGAETIALGRTFRFALSTVREVAGGTAVFMATSRGTRVMGAYDSVFTFNFNQAVGGVHLINPVVHRWYNAHWQDRTCFTADTRKLLVGEGDVTAARGAVDLLDACKILMVTLFYSLGVRMGPGLVREYPRLVLYGQHHVSPFFPCGCFPSVPHVLNVGAGHFCMTNAEVFVHAEDAPGPVLFARHTTAERTVFEMKGVKRIVYRSTQDPCVPPLSVNAPASGVITRAAIGNLIEL